MTIYYIDYVNGLDASAGTSWGTAWKTLTLGATSARIAPGDIIRIAKSPAPTSLGQNATWTNLSKTVTLTSAVTSNIYLDGAWTANTNVTATTSTTNKEGTNCSSLAVGASFTTGRLAHYATGTLNLSGYQQVSFWIRSSTAIASGVLTLNLCSDTGGVTTVNTIAIPAIPATGQYQVVTVNTGGALGASIQSVAIYALSDPATPTIFIDNIIACKAVGSADSLTLSSLISKNSAEQGGTEGWYGIKSINGTTIILDNQTNDPPATGRGYSGTTETVTTYKRETIKTTPVATSGTTVQEIMDSGTEGNNIQFQAGYDTGTGNQTGETFFDGQNGFGNAIYLNSKNYITLNYFNFCRYNYGLSLSSSTNNTITTLSNANNNYYGIMINSTCNNNTITTLSNINNNYYGIYFNNSSTNNTITTLSNVNNNIADGVFIGNNSNNTTITTLSNANNNASYGVQISSVSNTIITTLSNANNNIYGVFFNTCSNNKIKYLSTTGNTNAGVAINSGNNYINNALIAESTEVGAIINFSNTRLFSNKHDGTAYSKIFTDGGDIVSQASTLTNGSGTEWKITTASPNNRRLFYNYPLNLSIAKIAVSANNLVTVSAWFKKGHATDIGAKLVCRGGQIAGVTSDVTATKADDTNEEQLTITFTPTESGVVEIEAWAYNITGYSTVIVDALTVTQA